MWMKCGWIHWFILNSFHAISVAMSKGKIMQQQSTNCVSNMEMIVGGIRHLYRPRKLSDASDCKKEYSSRNLHSGITEK